MRIQYIGATIAIAFFFSCASKKAATPPPVIAPTPEELKVTQITPPVPPTPVDVSTVGPMNQGAVIAEGKMLYENNCGKCHRLFLPREFTNEQWKPLVLSMQKNTPINDIDIAKVLAYVTSENK